MTARRKLCVTIFIDCFFVSIATQNVKKNRTRVIFYSNFLVVYSPKVHTYSEGSGCKRVTKMTHFKCHANVAEPWNASAPIYVDSTFRAQLLVFHGVDMFRLHFFRQTDRTCKKAYGTASSYFLKVC